MLLREFISILVKVNSFTGIFSGFCLDLGISVLKNTRRNTEEQRRNKKQIKVKTDDTHLVWTDDEVQMLLKTTRDFKVVKRMKVLTRSFSSSLCTKSVAYFVVLLDAFSR